MLIISILFNVLLVLTLVKLIITIRLTNNEKDYIIHKAFEAKQKNDLSVYNKINYKSLCNQNKKVFVLGKYYVIKVLNL